MFRGLSSSRRSANALCALAVAIGAMAFGAVGSANAKEEACSSGAHTLSQAGDHVYPEMGNGGYRSVHTDVNLVYDAVDNEFLPGNNVELTQRSTQCLTDFSLDFAPQTPENEEGPGANMAVSKVFVDGAEANFQFVQPTYPGDPNGQNDPDPAAHETGQDTPVSATNPLPPACTPEGAVAADNGQPCPARKLVITPAAPIPAGETFVVKVEYTGHPGVYTDGGGEADGWFLSNEPAGDGSFVTTEPVGTEAWMPLNNHPSAKPTYDFDETVTKGRTVIANGELVKPEGGGLAEENAPDAEFPDGATTWRWHSPEPIANYLVENSIGEYELTERESANGVTYYEAQGGAISATQKAKNKEVMDQQEDITHFQERFNGPFPFTTDGVVVGVPDASFEEEMQGKITFNGGQIGLTTFNHENMHQWWGDNVSESNFNETFFKEGFAKLGEYLQAARVAAEAAGGLETPAGEQAFDASLIARFHTNYIATGTMWTRAPSNPTPATLFSTPTTYTRPATAYIALRQILGKGNFVAVLKQIQGEFGGGSIAEPQLEAAFREHLPNQSPACRSRLSQFFGEWFDTEFPAAGSAESLRPQLTGPGLDTSASGTTFYNSDGTCKRVAPAPPVTTATVTPNPVEAKVVGPATVTLQAQDPNSGIAKTEFKVDGAKNFSVYTGPFVVSGFAPHTVEFRSTNGDGVLEATKSVTFTVEKHAAPTTSATVLPVPAEGKVVGPATVVLSATASGVGVTATEFSLDGGAFQPYVGPIAVETLGDHTVEYRSTNADGVVETAKQLSFTVAPHQVPTTSATVLPEPVEGKVVGPARVVLSAKSNGSDVTATEFSLDGEPFQPYTGPIEVTAFGDHRVEYRSTDADGIAETAKEVAFTVLAHAAPATTASVLPAPVGGKVTGPVSVVLAATDQGVDVAATEFSLDGGAFQPYVGPIAVATLGAHTLDFRSTNADGIVETAKRTTFTVVAPPAPKPVCEQPHLTIAVSHPARKVKGVAMLLPRRAYRYTGRLTCGASASPAPAGTVVEVLAQIGHQAKAQPSVVVGAGGKIETLLQPRNARTVAFRYAADGGSTEARVRVGLARR